MKPALRHPFHRRVAPTLALFIALTATAQTNSRAPRLEGLTLEQALDLAEARQPQLAEARALISAAEGRAQQAGLFPNPELIAGAQQIPFSSSAPNEKEFLAGVGQTIPLGSRLAKARQAELLDREVRARGLEVTRRNLQRRVHAAFATALYQEQACETQAHLRQAAERAVTVTRARVAAGDLTREELARAEMDLVRTRLEWQRADALRQQSLVALAGAIGDASVSISSVAGSLETTFELPTLESLLAELGAQPEAALADADLRARLARVDQAKAERIPDVKVELLYHRLEASRENTFDVGLSLPLPLFNRNQGRLRETQAEVLAAEARVRQTRNDLDARLRESFLQLRAALAASQVMRTEILGRAETVLQAAETRHAAGDISLAELLPVRREWAAAHLGYLESLREVMLAWAQASPFVSPQ